MNKKLLWLFMVLLFLMCSQVVSADVVDGQYDVEVRLLKAYQDDLSMGNDALQHDAKLTVSDGKARLRIELSALEFMNFTGYLGKLSVNDQAVDIIESYDVFDQYNDPQNGIDSEMKGLPYPKVLEFPVDLNQTIIDCAVYVPVMAEMGSGSQKARIEMIYPADLLAQLNSSEQTQSDQQPATEAVTEPIYYRLPVELWHAFEDKPSMGNNAINHSANLVVEGNQTTLYIGVVQMSVMNINTSLVDLYYDTGEKYLRAERADYSLQVKDLDVARPRLFILPLREKVQFLDVMVDPRVEPMGEEPVQARLKLDFSAVEQIDKQQAELVLEAENGVEKPIFDGDKAVLRIDKGIKLEAAAGTFDNDFYFYADELHGETLTQIEKNYADQLPREATIKVYQVRALGELTEIPYDVTSSINDLRESYMPQGDFMLTIPSAINGDSENVKLYALDGELEEINYQSEGTDIKFSYDKFVPFAVVKENQAASAPQTETPANTQSADSFADQMSRLDDKASETYYQDMPQVAERPGIIMLLLTIFLLLLIGGIYFSIKYYKVVLAELQYLAELKKERADFANRKERQ